MVDQLTWTRSRGNPRSGGAPTLAEELTCTCTCNSVICPRPLTNNKETITSFIALGRLTLSVMHLHTHLLLAHFPSPSRVDPEQHPKVNPSFARPDVSGGNFHDFSLEWHEEHVPGEADVQLRLRPLVLPLFRSDLWTDRRNLQDSCWVETPEEDIFALA